MKQMLTCVVMSVLVLAIGCAEKEPERGIIQKKVEKTDDGKVVLDQDYYLNRNGQEIPHGITKRMYPDGKTMVEGEFKDGKSVGEWLEYYANGQKKGSVEYKDGLMEGGFTVWYENGQLKVKGQNIRGLQDGEWIYYAEDGTVIRKEAWDEGEDLTGRPDVSAKK